MGYTKACFYLTFVFKAEDGEVGISETRVVASHGILFSSIIEDERKRAIKEIKETSGRNVKRCFLINCTQVVYDEEEEESTD